MIESLVPGHTYCLTLADALVRYESKAERYFLSYSPDKKIAVFQNCLTKGICVYDTADIVDAKEVQKDFWGFVVNLGEIPLLYLTKEIAEEKNSVWYRGEMKVKHYREMDD